MLKHGISTLNIIPVREHGDEKSQMVTQLLFGETYDIVATEKNWYHIKTHDDQYHGFIEKKQAEIIDAETMQNISEKQYYTYDFLGIIKIKNNGTNIAVVMGSTLPQMTNGVFTIKETEYQHQGKVIKPEIEFNRKLFIQNSTKYLNAPYLWGGRTPFGIDCSGLVQISYKMFGIRLPRDASLQVEVGEDIGILEEALPGDLAFFGEAEEEITHVGIIMENNRILHASGKVRIDKLDHEGIYVKDTGKYSHHLRLIKRIVKES